MVHNTTRRLRLYLLAIIGSLLCLALLAVLFDPVPLLADKLNTARIRWELPRAMARWQSQRPVRYRVHVKGAIPLACFIDGELTVEEGRLVEVRMRQPPVVPDSPLVPVDRSDWQLSGCPYEDLALERMFERVKSGLAGAGVFGAPLKVQFDEEWGFVTEYRFGRSSRGGVFGYVVSECCTWFEFDDFTVIAR